MFQFNIVFGIVIAYVSDTLLSGMGPNAWRWMIGVAAVPSLIYTALCLGLPESPRWLVSRKHDAIAAMRVLKLIRPDASETEVKAEADAMGHIPSMSGRPAAPF